MAHGLQTKCQTCRWAAVNIHALPSLSIKPCWRTGKLSCFSLAAISAPAEEKDNSIQRASANPIKRTVLRDVAHHAAQLAV
jgi:hypothetical protein